MKLQVWRSDLKPAFMNMSLRDLRTEHFLPEAQVVIDAVNAWHDGEGYVRINEFGEGNRFYNRILSTQTVERQKVGKI